MDSAATQAAVTQLVNLLQGRRHRQRLPGWRERRLWRAGLPQGPVRDVHRRAVGGADVRGRQPGAELRHRAVPDRVRAARSRRSAARTLVVAAGGHHIADAEKFAEFLDSPFAQDAMASPGRHVDRDLRRRSPRSRRRPYYKVFAQQLKTAKVRAVSAGLQPDGHRLVERAAVRSSPARCPSRPA